MFSNERTCLFRSLVVLSLAALAVLVWCGRTMAQSPTYSVDYQGPTIGLPDAATGTPITEGDILGATLVPLAIPPIVISGGFGPPMPGLGLPLHPPAVGHLPGIPGGVEVDALSFGFDVMDDPSLPMWIPLAWAFSVDEFAVGLQGPIPPLPPNVSTEGAALFPAPAPYEASADVFLFFPSPAWPPGIAPVPPFAVPPGNFDALDGDGTVPVGPFGLGMIEPNMPAPGPLDMGDNLDAVDVDFPAFPGSFPVFFSLDSALVFDPIEGVPGSASAPANGPYVGGDVLICHAPGAAAVIYASAPALGLDLFGPDTDDLDALVLFDNGDLIFQPSFAPYDWTMPGGPDMLFFSVRRGSAIIGTPDFYLGLPICEGDILTPAGPPGTPPGIWFAAESLGLCTWRGGVGLPGCPVMPWGMYSDDVDALDLVEDCDADGVPDTFAVMVGLVPDCNGNNRPDLCDILLGTSFDLNGNGIPDECEQKFVRGDCNADAAFNIADAVTVLAFLFPSGPPITLLCDDACDANDSGTLDIADAITILNALFAGGPSPPAPHPNCGVDPTFDALTCGSFPPCP
ncbi:MAG: hypothetical protein KDC38_02380 [Planctomycetes bacterium]|nr:hypothetical protein [Planctomycetota bacterium]